MLWVSSLTLLLLAFYSSAATVLYTSDAQRVGHGVINILLWLAGLACAGCGLWTAVRGKSKSPK